MATTPVIASSFFEIRFESLFNAGRGLVFDCDDEGRVDVDLLSERARSNYLFARAMVGREYATPKVLRSSVRTTH